ncbi:DUF2750 domain-containing protein [Halioxenophilus sp. WMMB6]|uniref:DUF2750 domain-containing protein n=1 Tax=Halioxenophilus sp. WMMB6 TaxID=3073815 RepID=UPI00295E872B|nr:DUF2750 domain-containing protein [Halioxenophilus sp. WMMB6]
MTALGDDLDKNYDQFLIDALATGCVWGLEGPEGWALCDSESYPNSQVMPFWSQPEYAECHRLDEWQVYEVVAVSTEEFLDDWLPGMHDDQFLVGVNWNEELAGVEVEPLDLLEDFDNALEDQS